MRRILALGALGALLAGCAASGPPPSPPPAPAIAAAYQAAALAGRTAYRLDPAASEVEILVGRAGPLAAAGHVHVIEVAALEGYAFTASDGGRADLAFPLNALVVDPSQTRAALGGLYAQPLSSADRAGTRANMLGPQVLDSARYPWAQLAISVPAAASGTTPIKVTLTLHGVTRSFPAMATLALDSRRLRARGNFELRQSDYGIRPYTVLLGAVRVADTLHIRYHLTFNRWCPGRSAPSC